MSDWDGVERRHLARRRVKRVYRFVDRRCGFDRRRRYPMLGTIRDHPWLLVAILVAINLMSLVDGYLTAAEIGLGIAREGNPVLDSVAQRSPWAAIALKIGAMAMASAIIWHGRRTRIILAIALLTLAGYSAILALHYGTLSGLGYL